MKTQFGKYQGKFALDWIICTVNISFIEILNRSTFCCQKIKLLRYAILVRRFSMLSKRHWLLFIKLELRWQFPLRLLITANTIKEQMFGASELLCITWHASNFPMKLIFESKPQTSWWVKWVKNFLIRCLWSFHHNYEILSCKCWLKKSQNDHL